MKLHAFVRRPYFRRAAKLGGHKLLLLSLLLGLGTNQGAFASVNRPTDAYPTRSLEAQLAAYLGYPPALHNRQGVVMISFRLTAANRLTNLQVHSQEKALNEYIAERLTGKFVSPEARSRQAVYLVRLRFRLR
ncbi:MAG: hypothetical protein H7Z75_14260 [Ferruginibacter sp.]|nr:hypothetical protein [Cytophagales bacterium]